MDDLFPLKIFGKSPALIDGDHFKIISYEELNELSQQIPPLIGRKKSLIFLFSSNYAEDVIAYVGAMNAGHVVCLLDAKMHASFKHELVQFYAPDFIFDGTAGLWDNYECIGNVRNVVSIYRLKNRIHPIALHQQLHLLLMTSGTTGNPKLIRLSRQNIMSNALSIIEYLKITNKERAIATLPIHYSYGLSVLHTHLLTGASIVLTQSNVVQESLWKLVDEYQCTSLAGVPFTYKMMERIGFEKLNNPSLRTLTQAGGRLENSLVIKYDELMRRQQGRFFVMYGQTEATARIAYLPPDYLPEKIGAIGIAIPKGILKIVDENLEMDEPYKEGELVYSGNNVMLGYASSLSDLDKGDEMHGLLPTGDIGYFDKDGIFFVTGRLKRISKIYGLRINLDDIEKQLGHYGDVATTATDDKIYIYIENGSPNLMEKCLTHLVDLYQLHPSTFKIESVEQLPKTSSGKIDYKMLNPT